MALRLTVFTQDRPAMSEFGAKRRTSRMAPEVGLEPTTDRLTADCSTIELLWKPAPGRASKSGRIYKPDPQESTFLVPSVEIGSPFLMGAMVMQTPG